MFDHVDTYPEKVSFVEDTRWRPSPEFGELTDGTPLAQAPSMFEIWKVEGRSRVLVARFRMRMDADRYLATFGDDEGLGDATLELVIPQQMSRSSMPPSSQPPTSVARRTRSGVVVASEHPDEFIADQAEGDD